MSVKTLLDARRNVKFKPSQRWSAERHGKVVVSSGFDDQHLCHTVGMNWSILFGPSPGKRTFDEDNKKAISVICGIVKKLFPDFYFCSIHMNKNFPGNLHVDGLNCGPSVMLTVGENVKGGDLWYNGTVFPTLNRALYFDGNLPHMTVPYTGERYSIVCFTLKSWVSSKDKIGHCAQLRSLGFPAPVNRLPTWSKEKIAFYGKREDRLLKAQKQIRGQIKSKRLDGSVWKHAKNCK